MPNSPREEPESAKSTFAEYLQYAYFLRVSLLFWLFLPLLTLLDLTDVTATVTRGIFTLDVPWHWFWAGFFVVAINMTVLVTARTIVHNGVDRFLVNAPERLHRLLTDASPREQAYHGRIEDLHHVVFTIPPGKDHLSPLSWNLTKGQEKDIGNRADAASKWIRGNVVRWVTENRGKDVVSANEVCQNNTEPAP
jgi:hypothetical protein